MLLPNLPLQKSALKTSNNINEIYIDRRFKLWNNGSFKTLLSECMAIQHRLSNNNNNTDEKYISKNINRTLRLLYENPDYGKPDISEVLCNISS